MLAIVNLPVNESNTRPDRITLRFMAAPSDVSASGFVVPAGRVLEWIDKAAYACAVGWSGSYCVTAYVGNVHFTHPIVPGEMVEVHARIVLTGRSSMHVLVTVESSNLRTRSFTRAMHCLLVMVAVDDAGASTEIQPWEPWSDDDRTLSDRVRARIEPRATIQKAMSEAEYTQQGTTPRTVFRFLASPSDINWGGNVHGGTVMRWIDETAYACAAGWSSEAAVAVYSGGIQFRRPIHIGDVVEVDARLIHTGPHSMHVSVRVRSGPVTSPRDLQHAAQCLTIFVIPGEGSAQTVNPILLTTDEDRQLDRHARELVELRKLLPVIPASMVRYS
jgi:4-hydroxybenzoyl-CoA thioesterase